MNLCSRRAWRCAAAAAVLAVGACTLFGSLAAAVASTSSGKSPNLRTGSAYLAARANLIGGRYYESFAGSADFGLTIDGALALAASGYDKPTLRNIVAFLDDGGKDPSGRTVNDWTGIGTSYVSGGAIGKEALLAEVVGENPRSFGRRNLIAALDASVCKRRSVRSDTSCPARGSYLNDTSVFDQALGIMAQLRAGQDREAAAPIAYLERLQSADGSFPSLIPPSGGPDVDSTAMAVMAFALARGQRAATDVRTGLTWIASRQERNGGFPSGGAESVNSTGLAIQAMTLRAAAYRARIRAARAFLAREQNRNGGFDADAGQHRSNLRASTQAVGGAVGTSFGTLRRNLSRAAAKAHRHGGPARSHSSHRRLNAAVRQHRSSPRASARPASRSSSPAAGTSAETARRHHRSHAALASRRRADPSDARTAPAAETAWVAWTALPAVVIAIAAVILGMLLSRRRSRRPPVKPQVAAQPRQSVEPQQSPALDRVRS